MAWLVDYPREKVNWNPTIYLDLIEDVTLDIEFTNKGDTPLIVKNVSGCCGTQITDWTKKPLLPGENGTIKLQKKRY